MQDVVLKYNAKTILDDETLSPEFTMEKRECFSICVKSPFEVSYEWLTAEPFVNSGMSNGSQKTRLTLQKKASVNVKISTKDFQNVQIHDINLKLKEEEKVELMPNTSPDVDSKWNQWPITIGGGEMFSQTFSLKPSKIFSDRQIADVEIIWSRVNDKKGEKTTCLIPIPESSASEGCIELAMYSPVFGLLLEEFCIRVSLRNTTSNLVQIQVRIEESPNFLITGELYLEMILPPNFTDDLNYGMIPLKCGKLDIPQPLVSIVVSGSVSESIIDKNTSKSIYVMPTQMKRL